MSKPTTSYNNIYHADYLDHYHPRKGKMGKNKLTNDVKKIIQFKTKNNIGRKTWVSSWDVCKATTDKKRNHLQAKSVRSRGYDYKVFVQSNELPDDNYSEDDCELEHSNPYDCSDCSDSSDCSDCSDCSYCSESFFCSDSTDSCNSISAYALYDPFSFLNSMGRRSVTNMI